jgi:hypothetical protein
MDVYVKEVSRTMGLGVFAGCDFQPGELVLQAAGVLLDYQTLYSIQVDWDRHLDPDAPAKYLNHSCDPNLGVRMTGSHPEFFARRAISKDEQVCFDYAMTEYRHYPRQDPRDDFSLTCSCGSPQCRGRLGYYSELPEDIRRQYQGCFASYLAAAPQVIAAGAGSAEKSSRAAARLRTGPLRLHSAGGHSR